MFNPVPLNNLILLTENTEVEVNNFVDTVISTQIFQMNILLFVKPAIYHRVYLMLQCFECAAKCMGSDNTR